MNQPYRHQQPQGIVAKKSSTSAEPFVPETRSLPTLRKAARDCRGCPLFGPATQTVFGEGPSHVAIMLVGEQPGDAEDVQGHPFVGRSGQVLDRALADAGSPWLRAEIASTRPAWLSASGRWHRNRFSDRVFN